MIEQELARNLREFIKDAVKDLRLPVEFEKKARAPKIINGYLPPKRAEKGDDYPFVLVRPDAATSERDTTEVTVSIIIGCYAKPEEYDGYEYCMNVMTRIRNALTSMKDGRLAEKYVLNFPIIWNNVPEQPWPQWQLEMETKWYFNTPQAISVF